MERLIVEGNVPAIPPRSLVLGFAFSMTPEGLPGTYNEKLAAQILDVVFQAADLSADERPWIGLQWEIFDALEAAWPSLRGDLFEFVPLSHVGAPPLFESADVVKANVIVRHLQDAFADHLAIRSGQEPAVPSTQAGRVLAARIANSLESASQGGAPFPSSFFEPKLSNPSSIANCFNGLLEDDRFHREFYGADGRPFVELHDLYRTKAGSVGVEHRVLPSANSTLRRFQRLRVNRLIIEAIFPHELVLKPGRYLSTQGILNQLFEVASRTGMPYRDQVFIFGHPAHSPRCRRQFLHSAWSVPETVEPHRVFDVNAGQASEWEWDALTAQMCCRSKQNWDDYERMHQADWD